MDLERWGWWIQPTQNLEKKGMSKKKDLKIIGLPVGEDGCSWYRVRQPLNMEIGRAHV